MLWSCLKKPASSLFSSLNLLNLVHVLKLLLVKPHFNIIFLFKLIFFNLLHHILFFTNFRKHFHRCHACYMSAVSRALWYYHLIDPCWRIKIIKLYITQFFRPSCHFLPLCSNFSLLLPIRAHPQNFSPLIRLIFNAKLNKT